MTTRAKPRPARDLKSQLDEQLHDLRMPAIRAGYEPAARRAAKEDAGYEAFLLDLVMQETEQREQSRIERVLRSSRLPLSKDLASFDLKRLPSWLVQPIRTLMDGSFVDRRENVLAFGNPGSGKSHAVCAIAQEIVRRSGGGRKGFFRSCSLLIQDLLEAKRDLRLTRLLKRLSGYDVLVLDDLGYVQHERSEMEVLFTLLAERYERGSVMITSNLPFAKWDGIFKDAMTTAAAIDRLVHHSMILELNVPSYRLESAKARPAGKKAPEGKAAAGAPG
jgi:DNA replication protein DnaC